MTRWIVFVAASLLPVPGLLAQQPAAPPPARPAPTVSLSLSDALAQARNRSPAYRQVLNDAGPAGVAVRSAYGALIPSLDLGGSLGYTGAGASTFGGSTFNQTSPSITSGYGVTLSLDVSGQTLTGPATQKANRRAVDQDIASALITLDNDVTVQYLTVLQAVEQTDVARQQVQRNAEFLELARARFQVGQATLLDVRQAEVTKGRSDLELLTTMQTENEAKLELLRRMGVDLPVPVTQLALTDSFPVSEPTVDLASLLSAAASDNPVLRALRAREDASAVSVTAAKSQYLPSLRFSANWQGFTQEFTDSDLLLGRALNSAQQDNENCEFQNALIRELPSGGVPGFPNNGIVTDCKAFVGLNSTGETLLDTERDRILNGNNVWPFSFSSQPFSARLSISLPIFQGFRRNLDVARANAARDDAAELVRSRELQVRADVNGRYLRLHTAWQAIAVQEASRTSARDQLQLARERFRLGNGSALEVTDAQTAVARAEADYVNAVYAYHQAIAALELAVGRRLR